MEDYVKIYDECLDRTYHNSKLEPLINYLYEIVYLSSGELLESVNNYSDTEEEKKRSTKAYKTNFTKELLDIFNKVIDSNNYDNFDELMSFFKDMKLLPIHFSDFLSLIYDKEFFCRCRSFEYIFLFIQLSERIRHNKVSNEYHFDLYRMLICYKKYVKCWLVTVCWFYSRLNFYI